MKEDHLPDPEWGKKVHQILEEKKPMTREHFEKILENYEYILGQHVVDCMPFDRSFVNHLIEMCPKAIDHIKSGKTEKAMRWLGFIQGAMWRMQLRSIDEMRADNREK